jgi:hypothetical protein
MKTYFLGRFAPLREIPSQEQNKFSWRMSRIGFVMALCLTQSALAAPQNPPPAPPDPNLQNCAALTGLNLEAAPGGPAIITSARLVEVPATGLERWILTPSGFGSSAANGAGRIHEYCDVTGYVAPQNKFELKLPLPNEWNGIALPMAFFKIPLHVFNRDRSVVNENSYGQREPPKRHDIDRFAEEAKDHDGRQDR